MHVEKNVCENEIWIICGEKDNKELRWDLEVQNLRLHLWLTHNPQNPSWWMIPHANYVFYEKELSTFQSWFTSLKVPFKYFASLAKHVLIRKWASMKTHDWHVLMKTLFLLCLRGFMQENIQKAIMRLSKVF
jgi:hypothetical protein